MRRSERTLQTTVSSVQSGSSYNFFAEGVTESARFHPTAMSRTLQGSASKTSSNDSDTTVASFRWGATAPRSKRQKRHISSSELSGELHELIQSLHQAEIVGNDHRCKLILSYLLHAGHLVNSKQLIQGRYGTVITKLTTSSNSVVARYARAVGELWKRILLRELNLS